MLSPGPWSYAMKDNYARIFLHGLGQEDPIKGGDSLCGWCGEENARLIAAAPELFVALKGLLSDIEDLMNESGGVYGLHLNGDFAPWEDISEGGRFEWLNHLSDARKALERASHEEE